MTEDPKPIEPREIFMELSERVKGYEYPRDVQTDVWSKWFENRTSEHNIIKMNTGSGKTVVSLVLLQSCLNEGKGPAVYVVPDNYLISQVINEANKLGIKATTKRDDFDYSNSSAILVISVHTLVNGSSVFGMRNSQNYPIGTILIDDVHACLKTIKDQFSIKISKDLDLYHKIINIFSERWNNYDPKSYSDIVESQNTSKRFLVPFWLWKKSELEIFREFKQCDSSSENYKFIIFNFPLLESCFKTCNCIITANGIEITPKGIDFNQIKSYKNAQRKIYTSATVYDDSIFVSTLGIKSDSINEIITPKNANDIGDRLMIFPKYMNNELENQEIYDNINKLATNLNVVVLVPSFAKAKLWQEMYPEACVVYKDNIEATVEKAKTSHVGLMIFVNRYDGIDLPDDACKVLVIDGLPPLSHEYDKYLHEIGANNRMHIIDQVQIIEQGMGRGVRSNNDSCAIVFLGNDLLDLLIRQKGTEYFSNTTKGQFEISKELWGHMLDEKSTPSASEIFELLELSIFRDKKWVEISRRGISKLEYNSKPRIDTSVMDLRMAFDSTLDELWVQSTEYLDACINSTDDSDRKGYLLQLKAELMNFLDEAGAQEILLAARRNNRGVMLPIDGYQPIKKLKDGSQARKIIDFIERNRIGRTDFVIYSSKIIESLTFSQEPLSFEENIRTLGEYLGFESSREDTYGGPDNLWISNESHNYVIECKNGVTNRKISKANCNQLASSVRWFENKYIDSRCTPFMIINTNYIEDNATPIKEMRIMDLDSITKLSENIISFARALVQSGNWHSEQKISNLLIAYKLRYEDLGNYYTKGFIT